MIGTRIFLNRGETDEAEKPFWISFSDFMTALMALFLIVMATSLLIMSATLRDMNKDKKERNQDIDLIMNKIDKVAQKYKGAIKVDIPNKRITFNGNSAKFDHDSHEIQIKGINLIRQFTPDLINIITDYQDNKWFKSIIIKGFTDSSGSYLYNLLLSQRRASSVVCILLEDKYSELYKLTVANKQSVAKYFQVGGVSSNFLKETSADSRRVEFGVEFYALNEEKYVRESNNLSFGDCRSLMSGKK